jgi:DNA (cytosine-5)-methyltransferase 1
VLAFRFSDIPNLGDIKEIDTDAIRRFDHLDCVLAGFPCQDLSVAGTRAGLAGQRSGLFFELVRLLAVTQPRWVVLENVPGLLSSNRGRDFGAVLGALADLGYGYAWRVLDAQWFGVPQRRRRVFIVGHHADPARAAAVLLEPQGGCWHPPPRPQATTPPANPAGVGVDRDHATSLDRSLPLSRNVGPQPSRTQEHHGGGAALVVCVPVVERASALLASAGHHGYSSARGDGCDNLVVQAFALRGRPEGALPEVHHDGHTAGALRAADGGSSRDYLATGLAARAPQSRQALGRVIDIGGVPIEVSDLRVRRLTPLECERLMGLPDDWTLVPVRTLKSGHVRMACDSARYRQCENAVVVPVAHWIAQRIAAADAG